MKRLVFLFSFLSLVVLATRQNFCRLDGTDIRMCFVNTVADLVPSYEVGSNGAGELVPPPSHGLEAGDGGGFLAGDGGFGLFTQYGMPADYQLHFDAGNHVHWGVPTADRPQSQVLPGIYSQSLVTQYAARTEGSLQAFERRESQLRDWAARVDGSLETYRREALAPAAADLETVGIEDSIASLKNWSETHALPGPEWVPSAAVAAGLRSVSPAVDEALGRAKAAGDAAQFWNQSEDLWRVVQNGEGLPAEDSDAIQSWYQAHFQPSGLLSKAALGEEAGEIGEKIGVSLRTSPGLWEGQAVRAGLNKSLSAYASARDADRKGEALGAMALLVGADTAFAEGKSNEAVSLVNNAAVLTDLALGFVPVVGAINDAAQILHGIATGRDYAGQQMGQSDYALRGLGVVLGIVPVGAVVKFGGKVLSPLFNSGAKAIRSLGLGERYAKIFGRDRKMVVSVTEAVGHLADEASDISNELIIAKRKKTSFAEVAAWHSANRFTETLEKAIGFEESISISLLAAYKLEGPAFRKGYLVHHFWKHVVDEEFLSQLGVRNFEDYVLGAQKMLKGGPGIKIYRQADGAKLFYNPKTLEVAVEREGKIVTYFGEDIEKMKIQRRIQTGDLVPWK